MSVRKEIYEPVLKVMKQATVKALLAEGVDDLFDDNMHSLADSQEFTHGFVHHLNKSSVFTVPVIRFVKKQSEEAITSEA